MTPSIPTSLSPPTFSLFRPPSFLFPALSSFHPPPSPYPSCPPSLPPSHASRHFILTLVPQREGREREGREREGERESREREGKQRQQNTYFPFLCWPKPVSSHLPFLLSSFCRQPRKQCGKHALFNPCKPFLYLFLSLCPFPFLVFRVLTDRQSKTERQTDKQ